MLGCVRLTILFVEHRVVFGAVVVVTITTTTTIPRHVLGYMGPTIYTYLVKLL